MIKLHKLTIGKVIVWSLLIIWALSSIAHWIFVGDPLAPPALKRTIWGLFTFAFSVIGGICLAGHLIFIIAKNWDTPIIKQNSRWHRFFNR